MLRKNGLVRRFGRVVNTNRAVSVCPFAEALGKAFASWAGRSGTINWESYSTNSTTSPILHMVTSQGSV